MISKEVAVAAGDGGGRVTFYHKTLRNSDGSAVRCRSNGRCKVWKTRPDEFQLPVKYGLKQCFYITHRNCHEWCEDDPTDPPKPAPVPRVVRLNRADPHEVARLLGAGAVAVTAPIGEAVHLYADYGLLRRVYQRTGVAHVPLTWDSTSIPRKGVGCIGYYYGDELNELPIVLDAIEDGLFDS